MKPLRRLDLRSLLLLALGAHLLFGLLRLPHAAYHKRMAQIASRRGLGDLAYHLRFSSQSVAALAWLRDHTPTDAVVLFRGPWQGALEFAAPLLQPRLLYAEAAMPTGIQTMFGRPLARGSLPEGEGLMVLVAAVDQPLRLQLRR